MTTKQAIEEYKKAQKARHNAMTNYDNAQAAYNAFIDEIREMNGGNLAAAWKARKGDEREQELIAWLVRAEHTLKMAKAACMATSQNVADVACNVLLNAIESNVDFWTGTPIHYKKFKDAIADLLGDEFYTGDSYGYSFYVYYRHGEHGHNSCYVVGMENGLLKVDENTHKRRNENTLAEIRTECKRAFRDSEKLRKAVDAIKAKDTRETYKSAIRYYVPYLEVSPVHDEYRLF